MDVGSEKRVNDKLDFKHDLIVLKKLEDRYSLLMGLYRFTSIES
jgi:hypothetical protein